MLRSSPYLSGLGSHNCNEEVNMMLSRLALTEADYARRDHEGNRYVITGFMTCEHEFRKLWDDTNTWCQPNSVSIYRPKPPEGFYALGDIAQRHLNISPDMLTKVIVVKEPPQIPGEPPMLACPTGYGRVWPPSGKPFSSATGSVVFWEPIAPEGYHALGFVATSGTEPPPLDAIRCVHQDACELAHAGYEEDNRPIWKNKGKIRKSLGGPEMSLWKTVPTRSGLMTGTFVVRGDFKLPAKHLQDSYWCLKNPPLGTDAVPKFGYDPNADTTTNLGPQKDVGKRRIIAFVGGLDLTYGRWDTPSHTLYSTLDAEHQSDFLHGWGLKQCFGPREPWHDIHCKLEGPIARQVYHLDYLNQFILLS